jgi:hypothetical protein
MPLITREMQKNEEAVRRVLDGLGLPDTVVEYRLRFDNDSAGEPAVYIHFILRDDLSEKEFLEIAHRIRQEAMNALWQSEMELNPYIRFRVRSEQSALDKEMQKAGHS